MITDTIKFLMKLKGVKSVQLAAFLNMKPQSLGNKFSRNSWSAKEFIEVLDFLDCQLIVESEPDLRIQISNKSLEKS